ncbi:1-acyl-sn-glycerol-3-phosphate acyltransferase [Pedobacter sp. HMF7647]|uniref:1-acyl-sn-glycerol-3-phosphate acyltransferase n=1 Tax=Hufsiella arboris TaxID=2695275 RepID=A0A7K1YDQ0_9SPHI|nr:lysophospholipid acyltransferase family protein [Hufsiella arboris]MXV52199.1 1-acyl-sn-glycerol-3-phosphate acyltransferase [Hufsiella arboris]
MIHFFRKIHRYFYLGAVCFFFGLLFPFLYYFSRKPSRYKFLNHVRYLLGLSSSAAAGIFYFINYEEQIDWNRPYIICPNHTSNLDITAMSISVKTNFAFMGKDELLDNFVTRLFFKTIDIPVNRDSKISSFRAFKRAQDYLKSGVSVIIFPEGKIPDDFPPTLHSFKNGAFRLAIELKIPIIPVTIKDSWKKMWDDGAKYGSRAGICHICIHRPVDTKDIELADADLLRDRVFGIIKTELDNEA